MAILQVLRLALKDEPILQHDLVNCLAILAVVHDKELVGGLVERNLVWDGVVQGIAIDPLSCTLLQVNQQAKHVTATHIVNAETTRVPKDEAAARQRIEANPLGCR